MSYSVNDRWLWLGAGLALIIAVKGISYAIHDTVRLTRVKPAGKDEDEELQRQPEDSIPLDVLRTLATSPNPNISKSAIELISARCVKNSSLVTSVQSDAASPDPELRRKARTAMHFLSSYTLGGDTSNPIPPGMRTGGSTGALNLSPSVLSLDNGFEFDMGALSSYRPEFDSGAVWSTVPRDRHEPDVRRRHREAMVLQGGTDMLDDGDILRPRTT